MVSSDFYIQDNSNLEKKTLDAAKKMYRDGKYAEALKLYQGMLNASMSYKLYYEIGRCYYKLNNLLPSEEYFKKSIALENFKNPSFLYLGNLYFKRNDIKNAIENWSSAYAYKPDDEAVCLNLATTYFSKGMNFQSFFYYQKYLKYAKEKNQAYNTIKSSLDKYYEIGNDFFSRARRAIANKNNRLAIEFLSFAVKNVPVNFDANHLLGKIYLEESDYMHSLMYLKQALCIDNSSLDVLQKLASVYINLGDYTAAYCVMRRLLPLVLHNQSEYLKTLKLVKSLDETFDEKSYLGHEDWALRYDRENNYHMALIEYENSLILKESLIDVYGDRIERIKSFINPEIRIVKICLEKGNEYYNKGDYKTSNKYFTKVILMSNKNSNEYQIAKLKVKDV